MAKSPRTFTSHSPPRARTLSGPATRRRSTREGLQTRNRAFGAEGAAVVVNYARDHEGAERVVREITGKGGRAIAVQGDVAQRSDAQRLVAEAKKAFGRLDVLVNNAGVFSFAPFEQFSEQEFHRQFNTNVLGMFLMIEAALPAFGAEGGSIINIGSEASVTANPTLSIY